VPIDPIESLDVALASSERPEAQHVFITRTTERARRQAEASSNRYRSGAPLSALDGAMVVWKDLFDVDGTRTTAGSRTRRDAPLAKQSAPMVEAAEAAGMISLGKTNLSEFAFSGLGFNPHFGTPVIPHASGDRMPGGSSSGSAVAVRLGIARIGFGTDTAGSVRVPAAFNGLVGYRASQARNDRGGIFPLAKTFDTPGTITRTVVDCALVDAVLHKSAPVAASDIKSLRFVVDTALLNDASVHEAVRDNLHAALRAIAAAGAVVDARVLKTPSAVLDLIRDAGWPGGYEAFQVHRDTLVGPDADLIDPRVATRLRAAGQMQPERYAHLLAERLRLQWEIVGELDGAVLVMPTVAHTAPLMAPLIDDRDLFAETNLATLRLTMIGSFLDMPGIAMPTGTNVEGLATSLLLSIPQDEDDRLLSAALVVENALLK
jgi:aspartyl-tRNA(Asn)/glutamyl-tRNA(Gln) amidotransferase subunit A